MALSAARVLVPAQRTLADLDKADDDDESERKQLRRGKEVLHSGGRPHTVAVHKRQQDCRDRTTERKRETQQAQPSTTCERTSVTTAFHHMHWGHTVCVLASACTYTLLRCCP